ncbi:hypothetical protein MIND_00428800 [Mycena indigotica]|uniref:LYC1 C-terminal domain-containing protein n=1 Tax=Mycena indigotica TaxID=2126181 RepID=A0A8H6W808_9AGAR|nr:uncharacterized protein MIND_00428800 [Mycena indigotica]KAF7306376.1 hypothetical protein MIND_00428800 [Mycena indigotica]
MTTFLGRLTKHYSNVHLKLVLLHAPRDNPTTLDFKCACKTFKRNGLVFNPSLGAIEEVICYGIASVYTPPENRGHGFAGHMMSLLHWVLGDEHFLSNHDFPISKWGEPPVAASGFRNGRFSALWSDVGNCYSKCGPLSSTGGGWVVRGTSTTTWDVRPDSAPEAGGLDWVWLDDSGVSKLWQSDTQSIRRSLSTNSRLAFAFQPSHGVASYPSRRLSIYTERLANPPVTWGVASTDCETYTTWSIDPRPPGPLRLIVTRLRADIRNLGPLVHKLFELALQHTVTQIEIWGLSLEMEEAAKKLGAKVQQRVAHLPAFKWYGAESESEITWAFNEHFCWC